MHIPIEIQDLIFEFVESENRIYFKKNVMRELNLFNGTHIKYLMEEFLNLLDSGKYRGLTRYKHELKLKYSQEYYYWIYNDQPYELLDFEIFNPISY